MAGTTSESLASNETDSTAPISFRLHALDESLHDRHVIDLDGTQVPWDEDAFQAALNGTEFTTRHRPPFPRTRAAEPAYAAHNGSYYHLDDVVVGQETAAHPILRLYTVGKTDEIRDPPGHVAHEDLPQIDKQAVTVAYMAARARGNQGGVPRGLVQRGGYVYSRPDAEAESVLLDASGPTHVSYRNNIYRVETTTETFHEAVYRPDIEQVAETKAELEQILQAQLVDSRLDPDALSDDERAIIHEARGDGYEASYPYSEALNSLLREMDQRGYIDGNISKDGTTSRSGDHQLLEYGETYFEYRLQLSDDCPGPTTAYLSSSGLHGLLDRRGEF